MFRVMLLCQIFHRITETIELNLCQFYADFIFMTYGGQAACKQLKLEVLNERLSVWFVGVIVYVCIMQAATWFHCACCRIPTQNDKQRTLKLNLLRDAGKIENHWKMSLLPGPLLRKCAVKYAFLENQSFVMSLMPLPD